MTTATHHTLSLSQHACAAAVALDQGDATTAYSYLLSAERALGAAKREIQFHRPEAALNGVNLFSTREQQARVEGCVGHALRRAEAHLGEALAAADSVEDEILASIACDHAVEMPAARKPTSVTRHSKRRVRR